MEAEAFLYFLNKAVARYILAVLVEHLPQGESSNVFCTEKPWLSTFITLQQVQIVPENVFQLKEPGGLFFFSQSADILLKAVSIRIATVGPFPSVLFVAGLILDALHMDYP